MQSGRMPRIQVLGGIGSAALCDSRTMLDSNNGCAMAPADLHVPQRRDDGNLRDVDVLVLSTRSADISSVQTRAEATIGDELEISVFGLHSTNALETWRRRPFGWSALKTFLSDRYIDEGLQGEHLSGNRALFPFAVDQTPAALETWQLIVGDSQLPIPHPGATILNYLTRSISGLRAKDAAKVEQMATTVFDADPEVIDWIVDGPGKEQLELARILHTLRQTKENPQPLIVGGRLRVKPVPGDLRNHPAFMLHRAHNSTQRAALALARAKSRALGAAESNPTVVTLFQRYGERRLGTVVNNT